MALLLKGGRCVDPQVGLDAALDLRIGDDGTIVALGEEAVAASAGGAVKDCSGLVVTPGLVDIHLHFRDPGQEYKETIEGGVRSAAKGGFTDVATMPNTKPVCDTGALVTYQVAKAQTAGLTRVHPIGAITKGEQGEALAEIGDRYRAGACAFSDDGRGVQLAGMLRTAMDYIAPLDRCVISHCQDESLVGAGVVNEGAVSTRLGLAGWPAEGEELQVDRDIMLSALTGCPLHVALADGTIDCIVSDHAPHAAHEKALEFERAPFGIVGLETELPLVLTHLVRTGVLSWDRLVDAFCVKPRAVCRMAPVRIEPGCEATLTVIDPEAAFTVTPEYLESLAKNTPFIGDELVGCAVAAYVEGRAILDDGEVRA